VVCTREGIVCVQVDGQAASGQDAEDEGHAAQEMAPKPAAAFRHSLLC
jgi:hypothetical protein